MFLLLLSKTFWPQRFQIMNFISAIPYPFAYTTPFTPPLNGVKAVGTSTAGSIRVCTGLQTVSAQPIWLISTWQVLNVPVLLYSCCNGERELVSNESPS